MSLAFFLDCIHKWHHMSDLFHCTTPSRSTSIVSYFFFSYDWINNNYLYHSGCDNLHFHQQYKGSLLYNLINTCYLLSFWWQLFTVWGDTWLWFVSAFPWWWVKMSIFSCTCCHFLCLPWKNVHSGPLFIKWIFVFLLLSCMSSSYIWKSNSFMLLFLLLCTRFVCLFYHTTTCGGSWARDGTCATVVTWVTAVT